MCGHFRKGFNMNKNIYTIVFIKNARIMQVHLRYKLTYYCQYPSKLCNSRKWAKIQNLLKLTNFLMKMEVFVHRSSNAILWLTINFSVCFAIDFLNEIQLYLEWLSKDFPWISRIIFSEKLASLNIFNIVIFWNSNKSYDG